VKTSPRDPLYARGFAPVLEAFTKRGLNVETPGFYDAPAFKQFVAQEDEAMSAYARYVLDKPHSPEYLASAERIVRTVSAALHEELVRDGRLGACIDLSMGMSRMLERLGVWNFVVNGAVTTIYPVETGLPNGYYWPIHKGEAQAGHAWVCAPPFAVVDMTIGLQPDTNQTSRHAPEFVFEKKRGPFPVYIEDLCGEDMRQELAGHGLPWSLEGLCTLLPRLKPFLETFPGTLHSHGALTEYIPVSILEPAGDLDNLPDLCLNGRFGPQIWEETIAPLFR
jgi:hypothetical protein